MSPYIGCLSIHLHIYFSWQSCRERFWQKIEIEIKKWKGGGWVGLLFANRTFFLLCLLQFPWNITKYFLIYVNVWVEEKKTLKKRIEYICSLFFFYQCRGRLVGWFILWLVGWLVNWFVVSPDRRSCVAGIVRPPLCL